jgi:hypothetical protein
MDGPHYDSRAWTGEIGVRTPLPYHLQQQQDRSLSPPRSEEQYRAFIHAALLIVSPLLLLCSNGLLRASIPDCSAATPSVALYGGTGVLVAGFVLFNLVDRNIAARLCRWAAMAGWISMIFASFAWLAAGAYAHQAAAAGPVLRAQIVAQRLQSHRFIRIVRSDLALQDGTTSTITGYDGGSRHCLDVRRIEGPWGFSWLRIAGASPDPGPGQLAWPIDREICFSAAPLADMGH